MSVKLVRIDDNGKMMIQIDPLDVLHDILTGEQREQIIESLSCHEEIIEHVVSQLISGWTVNGYSGSWSTGFNTALQKAKKSIAENSSHAVEKTIRDMELEIKSLKDSVAYYQKQLNEQNRTY